MLTVVGAVDDILAHRYVDEVIIAIPSAGSQAIRNAMATCR